MIVWLTKPISHLNMKIIQCLLLAPMHCWGALIEGFRNMMSAKKGGWGPDPPVSYNSQKSSNPSSPLSKKTHYIFRPFRSLK